jgi:mRNA interferase MazF
VKRGNIITVAVSGDYGKPRPAVVVQADWLDNGDSVLSCQITTAWRNAPLYRLTVPMTDQTGLRRACHGGKNLRCSAREMRCGERLPAGSRENRVEPYAGAVIGLVD